MRFKLLVGMLIFLAALPMVASACTNHAQCSQACDYLGFESYYPYDTFHGYGDCPSNVYFCMTRDCCIGQCNLNTGSCFCDPTTVVSYSGRLYNMCSAGQSCGDDCRCHPSQPTPPTPPSFDCNSLDNWYDTSGEKCDMGTNECGAGTKEKKQEYRDYYPTYNPPCSASQCGYTVTNTRWVSAGSCYSDCPSGYTCQSGSCVWQSACTEGYTGNYRCYDDWIQKEYKYSNCDTNWVFYEHCPDGCSGTTCTHPSWCTAGYLDQYACDGRWKQRKYQYSDCRTEWRDWEYCSDYCSGDYCAEREACEMTINVDTPSDAVVGETVTSTITIRNTGHWGGYVNFDAYICKSDPSCHLMRCDGNYGDPRVYVSGHDTYTLTCDAKVDEKGTYEIKVSYRECGDSSTTYSGRFEVTEEHRPKCTAQFLESYRCSGNWKQQLYKYSDCSTAWVTLQSCSQGCSDGKCVPTTTTTTLPQETVVEHVVIWDFISPWCLIGLLLIVLLILLLLLLGRRCGCCKEVSKGNCPEWFKVSKGT